MNLSPMITELHRIFDALNAEYFCNELPPVFITIVSGKKKTNSVYGTFTPETWAKADNIDVDENGLPTIEKSDIHHEIAMSAEYFTRPTANWVATLVHEMVHLYCHINDIEDTSNGNRYHNKRFKIEAEKRGLIIERADVIGYSVTTPSMELINFVEELEIDEEVFKYFRDTHLGVSKTAPKKRYVCPICGLQVQAKKDKRILCGECEEPYEMDYWDLTDIDNPEILDDRNDGLALTDEGWYGAILNS